MNEQLEALDHLRHSGICGVPDVMSVAESSELRTLQQEPMQPARLLVLNYQLGCFDRDHHVLGQVLWFSSCAARRTHATRNKHFRLGDPPSLQLFSKGQTRASTLCTTPMCFRRHLIIVLECILFGVSSLVVRFVSLAP